MKMKKLLGMAVSVFAVFGLLSSAYAGNFDGAAVEGDTQRAVIEETPDIIAPPPGATIINFDDTVEPCVFASTVALRAKYAAQGVTFSGAAPLDGGAILDECGNFGVSGHSSPNFLAINCGSSLSDGGIPQNPEYLDFNPPVDYVQINAGSGSGAGTTVIMNAYDAAGNLIGSDSLIMASVLDTLSIAAAGISRVEITSAACILVLDDLAFTSGSVVVPQVDIDQLYTEDANGQWNVIFAPGNTIEVNEAITIVGDPAQVYDMQVRYYFTDAAGNNFLLGKQLYRDYAPGTYYVALSAIVPAGAAAGRAAVRNAALLAQGATLLDRGTLAGYVNIVTP